MHVIGAGVGRTGTYSLKLALNRLGLGPCHHMEAVIHDMPGQVPLWQAALDGAPDWPAIYRNFASAVDWPTAAFFRELNAAYPRAKFILSHRDPESWADSFSETIYTAMARAGGAPPHMQAWLKMAAGVVARSGFPRGLGREALIAAFNAHNQAVIATIPKERLLLFEAKQGWEPLCAFLGLPVPPEDYPRSNSRVEFWEHLSGQ
ncbi:MAG: hypothetical protein JO256_12055 [Alphaproteobacteria bacterium]|nr:hypothetical protein [Alphaproteobacteria bacterium]